MSSYKITDMLANVTTFHHAEANLVFSMQNTSLDPHDYVIDSPSAPTYPVNPSEMNCLVVPGAPRKNHLSKFRARNELAPVRLSLLFL